jgi:hypothetical protein
MARQSTQSFGIFSGSGGGGGGAGTVTSIAAGDGIKCTPDPITATGTVALASTNGLITSFIGGNAAEATGATGQVNIYSPSTFPPTEFTLNQFGRATINLQTAGASARIGVGGVDTFDLISFTATITTTCASGILAISPATNGIFGGKLSAPPLITCDGTAQSQILTFADFRVGATTIFPTSPTTDWISASYITTSASADIRYTNMELTITQYSAT